MFGRKAKEKHSAENNGTKEKKNVIITASSGKSADKS
jgi:hypothetical protein